MQKILEAREKEQILREYCDPLTDEMSFLAASPQMLKIRRQILQIAPVDVPVFFRHFLARYSETFQKQAPDPAPHLLEAALRYGWPGNLRELENFVKRYLILEDDAGSLRELIELTASQRAPEDAPAPRAHGLKGLVRNLKDGAETQAIAEALEKTNWCRKDAARLLGISYKALLYKMRQFNLDPRRASRAVHVAPRTHVA